MPFADIGYKLAVVADEDDVAAEETGADDVADVAATAVVKLTDGPLKSHSKKTTTKNSKY